MTDPSPGTGPGEYGPFDTEREALATRSAALIRAAYEAHPGVGASVPECLRILTDACEAYGVALGNWDRGFLKGVAWGETADTVSLAGMITRAYEAGKAAGPDGAVTEWAVGYTHYPDVPGLAPRRVVQAYYSGEPDAREAADEIRRLAPQDEPGLMSREVGPWKEVSDA